MMGPGVDQIELKSGREIEILHRANGMVLAILEELKSMALPGISTGELDSHAERSIRDRGGVPAFKGYRGFPASLCASINDEVVHGIPSADRVLEAGDIVSLDLGVKLDGFFGDSAITVAVGDVSAEKMRLIEVTRDALIKGIDEMRNGAPMGLMSQAIQQHAEGHGFSVVREFVGHGIGRRPHEEPAVPNYVDGDPTSGLQLRSGMVLAVEPMVNAGSYEVTIDRGDGWTARTRDGRPSAHFEYSVAVTDDGPRILGLELSPEGS
jgi:methionyl aminopeptidase